MTTQQNVHLAVLRSLGSGATPISVAFDAYKAFTDAAVGAIPRQLIQQGFGMAVFALIESGHVTATSEEATREIPIPPIRDLSLTDAGRAFLRNSN